MLCHVVTQHERDLIGPARDIGIGKNLLKKLQENLNTRGKGEALVSRKSDVKWMNIENA